MSTTLDDLAKADQHVALAERHVSAQQEVVAMMRSAGADVIGAEKLLAHFEGLAIRARNQRDLLAVQAAGTFAQAA